MQRIAPGRAALITQGYGAVQGGPGHRDHHCPQGRKLQCGIDQVLGDAFPGVAVKVRHQPGHLAAA